jgi:UDP-N-acetyl-D-glucosamine dehydrogenase
METLRARLKEKTATVGVVGLGYVGLPLVVELCRAGYRVIGVDVDERKLESLREGISYITDVDSESIAPYVNGGAFVLTSDFRRAAEMDAICVCVPTPLRKTKDPDISFVKASAEELARYIDGPTLVVLESTTYPGTTEELLVPIFEEAGHVVGQNLFLAHSPERVDPGNPVYHTRNTPKVIGGVTEACTDLACELYRGVVDELHPVGSAREAEMVKILENTFRAVNIALVNEMLLMCDRMGIDIWRVVDAAATKPFGFMPFYPGPGIGGHCIPIDPMYLSWKAKTYDFFNRFIELATDINGNMPRFVVQKLMWALNERAQHLRGSRILVVGLAYKGGVTDTRESPGLEIFRLLEEAGAEVDYHDPYVPTAVVGGRERASVELEAEALRSYAAALIATTHPDFALDVLVENAPLILDTRNALRSFRSERIVKL